MITALYSFNQTTKQISFLILFNVHSLCHDGSKIDLLRKKMDVAKMAEIGTDGSGSEILDFQNLQHLMEDVFTLCNNHSRCTASSFVVNSSSDLKEASLDLVSRDFAMQHIISIVVCNDHNRFICYKLLIFTFIHVKVPIIFGMIAIVGFFGNALVVVVVIANSQMRSTTNLLIINLALADLLFIVFCVPFTASDYALPFWPYGDVWCKIVQYLVIVTAYASVYTLVLMSLDRYLAVVHPFTSKSIRTKTNTYWAIAVTWVFYRSIKIIFIDTLVFSKSGCYLFGLCTTIDGSRPSEVRIFRRRVFSVPISPRGKCKLNHLN